MKSRNSRSTGDVLRVYNASIKAEQDRDVLQAELLTYPNLHAWSCVAAVRYEVSVSTMSKFAREMKLQMPAKPPKRFNASAAEPAPSAPLQADLPLLDILLCLSRIEDKLTKLLTGFDIKS